MNSSQSFPLISFNRGRQAFKEIEEAVTINHLRSSTHEDSEGYINQTPVMDDLFNSAPISPPNQFKNNYEPWHTYHNCHLLVYSYYYQYYITKLAILLLHDVYITRKKSPIGQLWLCPCVVPLIHCLSLSITVTYIIVYVTTHPYCVGCTVGLLLYTDRLVITLQTNWVRYSHTNHRKHYFNKRKEKEGITTFMKRQNRA